MLFFRNYWRTHWRTYWVALSFVSTTFLCLLTYRPQSSGIKLFGKPRFSGGPKTKENQLTPILAKSWQSYSTLICLSAVRVPLFALKILKTMGVKIIVNQNGVYYPAWSVDYKAKNTYLYALTHLADHVYFQSEFAKKSYQEWVGALPESWSILYNAVDRNIFFPRLEKEKKTPLKIIHFCDVSSGTELVWKYILELKTFLDSRETIEWIFVGRVLSPEVFSRLGFNSLKNVFCHWDLQEEKKIAEVLREANLALHFRYNDVCPNKVLELMASGVWVVTLSAGGSAELVSAQGGCVLPVQEGYGLPHFPEKENVLVAIRKFLESPDVLQEGVLKRAEHFKLENWHQTLQNARSLAGVRSRRSV